MTSEVNTRVTEIALRRSYREIRPPDSVEEIPKSDQLGIPITIMDQYIVNKGVESFEKQRFLRKKVHFWGGKGQD